MPTDTRPLPVDVRLLRQYFMRPEPDTTVSAWRATITRIDEATADVHAEIVEADQRQRTVVAQLVELARDGRDMGPVLKDFRPARAHAEQRLHLLGLARSLAVARLARAEHNDAAFVGWRQECERLTTEWTLAKSGDTEAECFAGLLAFARSH